MANKIAEILVSLAGIYGILVVLVAIVGLFI